MAEFKKGVGRWSGTAEVYNGAGQFLGHALDRRNVQELSQNQVRIDLSFMGPLMLSGYYVIESHEGYRLYQGPANVGYAETLDEGLVEANNYWAHWGLSQRFFLYVSSDKSMQLSLALLSRGEQLQYVVVGEYYRLPDEDDGKDSPISIPESLLIAGTPADKANDPTAGRGEILLHRQGCWQGDITVLDGDAKPICSQTMRQIIRNPLEIAVEGSAFVQPCRLNLQSNGWQAWTGAGDVVGSYSLTGGRALSGQFHHINDELRVWWREVVTGDGNIKAILQIFYRGGQRIGIQFGLLHYER